MNDRMPDRDDVIARLERMLGHADDPNVQDALSDALTLLRETWRGMETAPKDGTEVDVWVPEGEGGYRVPDAYWSAHSGRWQQNGDLGLGWSQPTLWRPIPLPQLPKEGG